MKRKEETRSAAANRRNEFKVCPVVCVSLRNTPRDLVAHLPKTCVTARNKC